MLAQGYQLGFFAFFVGPINGDDGSGIGGLLKFPCISHTCQKLSGGLLDRPTYGVTVGVPGLRWGVRYFQHGGEE